MTPTSAATPGTTRPASIRSYHTDYFSLTRSSSSRPADLTPTLAQATEFRVPTHDAPQKVTAPRPNTPVPHAMHSQWERDAGVAQCRSCHKRFTFYFRKVSSLLPVYPDHELILTSSPACTCLSEFLICSSEPVLIFHLALPSMRQSVLQWLQLAPRVTGAFRDRF